MKALIITIFVSLALMSHEIYAATDLLKLDVRQPRAFGYHIGDKFERLIELRVRKSYQFKKNSLPVPGRITRWLAMEAPQIVRENLADSVEYDIRLTYQIINIDPQVHEVSVPHHELLFSDGNTSVMAFVPASRVGLSVLSDRSNDRLQVDRAPQSIAPSHSIGVLFGCLLLCAVAGLAYLYWGLPFLSRARPFTEVYRSLRKFSDQVWREDHYSEALREIHRAFNETAGKTVFLENLGDFFNNHRQYASLKSSINDYFSHSRKYFFTESGDRKPIQYSRSDLVALAEACSDIERGLS